MLRSFLSRSHGRTPLFLLSITLLLLTPALGQTETAEATETDPAAAPSETQGETTEPVVESPPVQETPPNTIPLEEVAVKAQAVLETVMTEGDDPKRPDIFDTIDKGAPMVMEELADVQSEIESIRESGRTGRRLVRIDDELNSTHRQLDEWSDELVNLTRTYQENLSANNEALELWTNTRASITDQDGTESLIEQIDTVIAAIQQARDNQIAARDAAVQYQTNVAAAATRLTGIKQQRSELSRESRHQIFLPDSPTLWDVSRFKTEDESFKQDFNRQMDREFGDIGAYAKRDPYGIILQFLIMLITPVFLIRVRQRHQDTLENDPRTKSAAKLLDHPIATGIVIALVLTPLLIRQPPLVYYRYAIFLVLIPVFLLLKTTMVDRAKSAAYATIVLYVALRLGEHMPEFSIEQRFLFLGVAVAGLVISILKVRQIRALPTKTSNCYPFERIFTYLGVLVYSASAVTNAFGIFALSQRLLLSYIGALTLALILIAGLNAIREFLRISMVVGPLRHLSAVRYHYATVDHTIYRVLRLLTIVMYAAVLLMMFNIFEPAMNLLKTILDFGWQVGALNLSIGAILNFILAIWLAVIASRSIRFVVNADILPRFDLPRGIPSTISMMLHYGIITLGIFIAMAAAGINLSQLSLIVGALGVGIGFGLQNLVNNFVSGLILIFERPIKVGDKISFGTNMGEVRSIGIRASNVRKFDGAEIIVPNGNLISNEVTNWTLSDQQRRMDVIVGVAYGNDPEVVLDLLNKVLSQFDEVLEDPAPFISFDGFGECSLDFTVRFWIDDFSIGLKLKSRISIAIYRALNEAGIEIPFPQRDLHLRSISEAPARTLAGKAAPEEPTPKPT